MAAPSSSAYSLRNHNNRISPYELDIEPSVSSVQSRQAKYNPGVNEILSTYENQGIILHGKNDREKELSLCEAGIVSACRSSIEAAQSESDSLAVTGRPFGETLTLALDLNIPNSEFSEEDELRSNQLFPSAEFLMIVCVIVCIITIARRCMSDLPPGRAKDTSH